jgi:hypothetical protein
VSGDAALLVVAFCCLQTLPPASLSTRPPQTLASARRSSSSCQRFIAGTIAKITGGAEKRNCLHCLQSIYIECTHARPCACVPCVCFIIALNPIQRGKFITSCAPTILNCMALRGMSPSLSALRHRCRSFITRRLGQTNSTHLYPRARIGARALQSPPTSNYSVYCIVLYSLAVCKALSTPPLVCVGRRRGPVQDYHQSPRSARAEAERQIS